jgi:hypothetical protein
MVNRDTDRVPTESGWLVWCDHCNTMFESKRSDASYCSAKCRMGAKREAERLQAWIDKLPSQGAEYLRMARKHKRSDKVFKAMLELQKQLVAALYEFETD